MGISNLTATYQLIWFLLSCLWIPKQLFTALGIPEAFFPPCKYQNSYSMTGESIICVKLLHCVLGKDIMCFSLWMTKRKWEVELPEVCLQTWKEGVKCCVQLGGIRKAVLYPVLSTERAWNPPRGRGAVFKWRTRFSSLLLPPRSELLMHAVHWQLLRCWMPGDLLQYSSPLMRSCTTRAAHPASYLIHGGYGVAPALLHTALTHPLRFWSPLFRHWHRFRWQLTHTECFKSLPCVPQLTSGFPVDGDHMERTQQEPDSCNLGNTDL